MRGRCWDCFGFSVHSDCGVVKNAFVMEPMRIAKVVYAPGEYFGPWSPVWLSVHQGRHEQVTLCELCTLRAVRHWISVWRRSCLRRRLKREKREKRLASRVMLQYCRGVEDSTTLVHSFLCG